MQIQSHDGKKFGEASILHANESARVDGADKERRIAFVSEVTASTFVRTMSRHTPTVFLADTFHNQNVSTRYKDFDGWGLNEGLSLRQTGSYGSVCYLRGGDFADMRQKVQVCHPNWPNTLTFHADTGDAGWVVLGRSFPHDTTVSATLDPVASREAGGNRSSPTQGDRASINWIAVGVRGDSVMIDNRVLPDAKNSGAVLLVRSNGGWEYFENGIRIAEERVSASNRYQVVLRVLGTQLLAAINKEPLNLDPGKPGYVHQMAGLAATTANNYVSIGVNHSPLPSEPTGIECSTVENLTIANTRFEDFESSRARKSKEDH
jgi:hypothetical protein